MSIASRACTLIGRDLTPTLTLLACHSLCTCLLASLNARCLFRSATVPQSRAPPRDRMRSYVWRSARCTRARTESFLDELSLASVLEPPGLLDRATNGGALLSD